MAPDKTLLPPFLGPEPLESDPPCEWKDFLTPQLRRFPRSYDKIRLQQFLGNGIEGCVARVHFGDDDTNYALKTFFTTIPTTPTSWWSLEREARNAAILEKVSAALRQSDHPIHVPAHRTTRRDCLRCLYALSAEGRAARPFDSLPRDEKVNLSDLSTRLRECYGWVRVLGKDVQGLNEHIKVDELEGGVGETKGGEEEDLRLRPEREYYGLVYEYLEGGEGLETGAVQRQLEFLYHIGFQPCQGVHADNWRGPGVLLDLGDYEAPVLREFQGNIAFYGCPDAEWIVDKEGAEKRAERKWEREEGGGMEEVIKRAEEKLKGAEESVDGGGPGKGEEERSEEEEKERALRETAKAVELSYQNGKGSSGYCELSTKERRQKGLLQDPLGHIKMLEVDPETVREAWKKYEQEREEYFAEIKARSKSANSEP